MIRMAIQVVLIDEAEDRRDVHEIARIDRAGLCAEALGLSLVGSRIRPGAVSPSSRRWTPGHGPGW
jgi:hypothetical protein